MDILIAGGAGFVGINFIQLILDKYPDYNIVCIGFVENEENLKEFENNQHFYFYRIDICNFDELLKIFKFWYGFDVIINFSVESQDRNLEQKKSFIDSNIMGTYNFLEIIKKYKTKKYLQVSSELELNNSLCSAGKTSADLIALSYFAAFKIPVIVLRSLDNYGFFQHPRELIPEMITSALIGEKVPVYNPSTRDWINVLDHCRALETLMHYGKPGEIYNLGTGNSVKSVEIAYLIIDYLKLSSDILEKKQGNQESKSLYSMDFSKLNEEFGWKPIIDFKQGILDTIEWYKSNESWWRQLKTQNC